MAASAPRSTTRLSQRQFFPSHRCTGSSRATQNKTSAAKLQLGHLQMAEIQPSEEYSNFCHLLNFIYLLFFCLLFFLLWCTSLQSTCPPYVGRASDPHLVLPLLARRLPSPESLRRTLALTAGGVEGAPAAEPRKPAALAATLQVLLELFNSQTNQPTNPTPHHTSWLSLSELCLQHHLS